MKHSLIKFPNGLKMIVCSKNSNVVTMSFSLLFGAEQEKKNQSGISSVIEKLMRLKLSSEVINLGGVVDSKTDYEHIELTVSTIRENLEVCLEALNRTIFDFHPTYTEFAQVQARALQSIEKTKSNPLAILSEITQKNRYKTTSLATELVGTTKSISELKLEDVREYYKNILVPKYMFLSVVGNISDEVGTLEEEIEESDERLVQKETEQGNSISSWNALHGELDITKVKEKKYKQDSLDYIKDLLLREFYSKTINLKSDVRRRSTAYFPLKSSAVIQKNKNLNQSRFQLSLPSAPYSSLGYKYSKLFEIYLRSYLVKALRGVSGLYGLDVEIKQFKSNAHLSITFAVDYEEATDVYKKVKKVLRELRVQEIGRREFNSVKRAYQTIVSLGNEKMSDLARRYNKWLFLNGELFSINKELKQIGVMNYEDYLYITNKMLDPNGMLTVYLGKKLNEEDLV